MKNFILCLSRYNCNRYNEDDAKKARDNQEVSNKVAFDLPEKEFLPAKVENYEGFDNVFWFFEDAVN